MAQALAEFQLDTSGVVYVNGVAHTWEGSETPAYSVGLSPFVQGYVEALPRLRVPVRRRTFKNPKHQEAYNWYLANQPDPEAHKGKGAMGNAYAVGRLHPDSPHAFAVRGSLAYATWCAGADLAKGRDAGFSDLAPETLARIIEDCARASTPNLCHASDGRRFWERRRAGTAGTDFPPLTVALNDAGKVVIA